MQCPIDGTELVMTERQGVEIDYCPKCRGVWLDRGELDKIIDRASADMPQAAHHRHPSRPHHRRQLTNSSHRRSKAIRPSSSALTTTMMTITSKSGRRASWAKSLTSKTGA
jgi:uncharacterized protein